MSLPIQVVAKRWAKKAVGWQALTYEGLLEKELLGSCQSVLDVGCGVESPISRFSTRLPFTVGVDAFAPSIARARAAGIHDQYEQLDLLKIETRFGAKSFDAAVALDVIEHFDREGGLLLLQALEAVARKKVIVFTPNGFSPQEAHEDNPWQVHKSGWTPADFRSRGYRLVGINGLRFLRGKHALPTLPPRRLGERLSQLSQPLVTHRPAWAYQLLAIRDL